MLTIVVTLEAAKKITNIQQIINSTKYNVLHPQNIPKPDHKNKKREIVIYDVSKNIKTSKKIIPINNHINKTGSNPLRGHQKQTAFYDITQIYQKQKNAKIAVCFGNHPPKEKNGEFVSARFLCHYTILAYCAGFKFQCPIKSGDYIV